MDNRSLRVVKNTLFLYLRMIFLLIVSLYTSRVILANLGVSDFGLYNVVGGLITIFTFVNNSMAQASQRYITYYLGKGEFDKLRTVFSQSFFVHLGLAILIIVLVETVGLWYFHHKMVIDPGRKDAALIIFHITAIITFLNIIVIPFRASIISHEKMSTFAYISIVEGILKLIIAIVISFVALDKLIVYGFLMFAVTIVITFSYIVYPLSNFEETRVKSNPDFTDIRELFSFAGWSLFGSMAAAGYTQGLNLILNAFFNTTINAARGISVQIQSVVRNFSTSFMMAVNPQITKSFASQDMQYFYGLIYKGSKYSFFLFLCIAAPVFWSIDFLLNLWLVEVPKHTDSFVRIMLMISCVEVLASPLNVGIQATGKNKFLELFVSSILLLIIPLSYISLKIILEPEVVFWVDLLCVIISHVIRIIIAHRLFSLPFWGYIENVVWPLLLVTLSSCIFLFFASCHISNTLVGNLFFCIISFLVTLLCIIFLGLDIKEKQSFLNAIKSKIVK